MNKYKKTLLIDLDGVLNTYTGNYDPEYIPPVKEGAKDFLIEFSKKYKIKIFTTREPKLAMKWVNDNGLEQYLDGVTNVKEPAYLIIDNRCTNFDGNYRNLKYLIENFKVWYK